MLPHQKRKFHKTNILTHTRASGSLPKVFDQNEVLQNVRNAHKSTPSLFQIHVDVRRHTENQRLVFVKDYKFTSNRLFTI
jgi:hypothetical protein